MSEPPPHNEVTRILKDAAAGDRDRAAELLPLVYEQLRAVAQQRMNRERPDHTLGATALVHEAFIKLIGTDRELPWANRQHFYAAAAEAMRQILLDHVKARNRLKRGGTARRVPLSVNDVAESWNFEETAVLDAAIRRLGDRDPGIGEVVRLRFFAGLTIEQTAAVLGVSPMTVKRRWEFGRTWLFRALNEGDLYGERESDREP